MINLIIYWFKLQANKAAGRVLSSYYEQKEIDALIRTYWNEYIRLKQKIIKQPTLGGNLMVNLAAMSTAFYKELTVKGQNEEKATKVFYDIAWMVYKKMGSFFWLLAGWGNPNGDNRLLKATQLFKKFPFNSPSYKWQDVQAGRNIVGFDCMKCPVAEYFKPKGLSKFCAETWCALDYPLAEMWNARLIRTGSIAGGANKCDFRWISLIL